jgi:hypothetical protein
MLAEKIECPFVRVVTHLDGEKCELEANLIVAWLFSQRCEFSYINYSNLSLPVQP